VYIDAEFAAIGRLLQRNKGPIFHLIEDMFGQPMIKRSAIASK
jgi:GntR family transcriptional regulator